MCGIRSKCAWLVLVLLVSASPVGGDPPGKSEPTRDASRERLQPSEDTSLSLEDYIAAGVPAYDRKWTSADMAKAYKALQKVAKDKRRMPRYGSERSGQLFDRITSEENLAFLEDGSTRLSTRCSEYFQYIEAAQGIGNMYASLVETDKGYASEMVEIIGAAQRAVRAGLKVMDERLAEFEKSDPRRAKEASDLIKGGMAQMATGCLETLENLPSQQTQARK